VSENLFFAVFPDAETAKAIVAASAALRERHGLSGKISAVQRLHVTIAFLGGYPSLPESLVTFVSTAARKVRHPAFAVSLDQAISFNARPGQQPLVLVGDEDEQGLRSLRRSLSNAFVETGLSPLEDSYQPHLTLSYADTAIEPEPMGPFIFRVEQLVLVRSLVGQDRYVPLDRWRLEA